MLSCELDVWQRMLAMTQVYLRNRLAGEGCDREMIEAWREFYCSLDPIIRSLTANERLTSLQSVICREDAWLEIITGLPRRCPPATQDSLLYWMANVVRTCAQRLTSPAVNCVRDNHTTLTEAPRPGFSQATSDGQAGDPSVRPAAATISSVLAERMFQLLVIEDRSVSDVAETLGLAPEQVALRQRAMLRKILSILITMDAGCRPLVGEEVGGLR